MTPLNPRNPDTWPAFQLCQAADVLPTGDNWIYQQKLDGVRAMLSETHLKLRNIVFNHHRVSAVPGLWDGELMCRAPNQIPAQVMSHIARGEWSELTFQPFDVLYLDEDLSRLEYSLRKTMVRAYGGLAPTEIEQNQPIPSEWEGVVAKNLKMPYQPGRYWYKKKNWWLMDAVLTDLQWNAGELVTGTFNLKQDGKLLEIGKATINDPIVRVKILAWDKTRLVPILPVVVRHFGLRPGGVKNPHVVEVIG